MLIRILLLLTLSINVAGIKQQGWSGFQNAQLLFRWSSVFHIELIPVERNNSTIWRFLSSENKVDDVLNLWRW